MEIFRLGIQPVRWLWTQSLVQRTWNVVFRNCCINFFKSISLWNWNLGITGSYSPHRRLLLNEGFWWGYIPLVIQESVLPASDSHKFWDPPASLNFLSLAASAPATPDPKFGRLLGISRFYNLSRYRILNIPCIDPIVFGAFEEKKSARSHGRSPGMAAIFPEILT
jgi:hypothetical protein